MPAGIRFATRVRVRHVEPLIEAGLEAALARVPRFAVVADWDGASIDEPVDVLVTDYEQAIRHLGEAQGTRRGRGFERVMVVSTRVRSLEVRHAIDVGVLGFLLTSSPVETFVDAVGSVAGGNRVICVEAAQKLADSLGHTALSSRETEVLRRLVTGVPNKTIASDLGIGIGTVKTHVKTIFQKLDAKSRTHAAAIALQRGLLRDDELAHAPDEWPKLSGFGHGGSRALGLSLP